MTAEITTRDIDRGGYPHFLLKEISEAPESFRKTLRGKIADADGRLSVALGRRDAAHRPASDAGQGRDPPRRRHRPGDGGRRRPGLAAALARLLAAGDHRCRPCPATELSGFGLDDDMSDTLVVAISQSGTTTDTNRTVDLVRARGAAVLAIVNRRNSDLAEKADGVLYTSDGRDVEMSVASTKAFYAQVGGRLPARPGRGAEARGGAPPGPGPHDCCRPARAARGHGAGARRPAPRSPLPPRSTRPAAALLGRGGQRGQPGGRRRAAHQALGARPTSRSPATPPRTRSTSTCPPSR